LYRRPGGDVNLREKLPDVKQKPFLATDRTPDAGKHAARVAAVEVALNHILDDRPKEAVLLLETSIILGQEPVEMMEQ
jgi:hypothetical protein